MKYAQILNEAPQAVIGDWDEGAAYLADMSLLVYRKNWKKVGSLRAGAVDYDIAKCVSRPLSFMVGREDPSKPPAGKFVMIASLDLEHVVGDTFGYQQLQAVNHVVVTPVLQGLQVGTQLYRFVVKTGVTLLSDMSQYFGARRLWSRMSQQADLLVDVVDTHKNAVVARGVKLHQGVVDADFDKAYWSYDIADGKHVIRFVMRDIAASSASPVVLVAS